MSTRNIQPLPALWPGSGTNTTYVPMHPLGKPRQMESFIRRIVKMAQGSEQGPDIEILLVNTLYTSQEK